MKFITKALDKLEEAVFGRKEEQAIDKEAKKLESEEFIKELRKVKMKDAVKKAKERAKKKKSGKINLDSIQEYAKGYQENYLGDINDMGKRNDK